MQTIYLDNNATTRCLPEAVAAMLPFFTERFGNASSSHVFGADVARAVRQARCAVAAMIGAAEEQEIVFTSGGSESDNTAILSALATMAPRNEIVTSAVEHPAILALCGWLEKTQGVKVHRIGVDGDGRLDLDAYRAALSDKTALVTLMWANNETGTVFPVDGLADIAHEHGALFHTDAVQAAGKVPIRLSDTSIDMLSLSGHKLHGPKGIGVLYLRKGVPFRPLIRGGHQERGRRAGTENVPGIVGLGRAAEILTASLVEDGARMARLRDRLETGLTGAIPRCLVLGDRFDRLPNTLLIAFEYIEGEAVLMRLNEAGIAASMGSACNSGAIEPSHVLRAMNVPFTAAHGAIRFSLSRETTEEEIDRVLAATPGIVAALREMSPFWNDGKGDPGAFARMTV